MKENGIKVIPRRHAPNSIDENKETCVKSVQTKKSTPIIDFSKIPLEQRQWLKEGLAETPEIHNPFARKEEAISLTSITASIAIDLEQQRNAEL